MNKPDSKVPQEWSREETLKFVQSLTDEECEKLTLIVEKFLNGSELHNEEIAMN
jgi:C4-type Zn-finger protein